MKSKFLNDVILVAAVLVIAATALCTYLLLRSPGQRAVVTIYGEEYAVFSLNENIDEEIVTEYGMNRLVIKDGLVSVSEASCPDLICVHHHAIAEEGEIIACKPNGFAVSIE